FNEYWGEEQSFAFAPIVVGALLHLVMSVGLGALFAWLADRSTGRTLVVSGLVWGLLLWAISQLAILPLVDPVAAQNFPWWLFAPAHALYGLALGWFLARVRAQPTRPLTVAPQIVV